MPGDGQAADEVTDHVAGAVREGGRVLVVSDAPGERRAAEGRRAGRVRDGDLVAFLWIGAGNGAMNGYAAMML